jgi:hypothetical protein
MGAYYYAGGRKVQLQNENDLVAVDRKAAERAGLDGRLNPASEGVARLASGIVLLPRTSLGDDTIASLRDAGALQPVYRHDRAVVVALPEVRVEFETPAQRRAVLDLLSKSRVQPHDISESTDDRLVVRLTSGDGGDALKMANQIYERAHPAAASVRFIQFVPKPALR